MLKFITRLVLLGAILLLGAVYGIQWNLKTKLDEFARQISPFAEFTYQSLNVGFDGEVKLASIEVYLVALDTTIEISQVQFSIGDLSQLILFDSDFHSPTLPESAHLKITNLFFPFSSGLTRNFKQKTRLNSMDILASSYCGNNQQIGISQLEAMGYNALVFSAEIFHQLDERTDKLQLSGSFEHEDAFKSDFLVVIDRVMGGLESMQGVTNRQTGNSTIMPELSLLELNLHDLGYNQRKAEYCAGQESSSAENYYPAHLQQVEQQLKAVGIQVSESFRTNYLELIKPGSHFYWLMEPKTNFQFSGLSYYTYEEFINLSGSEIKINNKPIEPLFESWSFINFVKIAELEKSRQREQVKTKQHYKNVIISREYQNIPLHNAKGYINLPVKITRDDGRLFEGVLSRISETKIWVLKQDKHGDLELPVKRNRIKAIQAYLETSSKKK